MTEDYLIRLKNELKKHAVNAKTKGLAISCESADRHVSFQIAGEDFNFKAHSDAAILHLDQIIREPVKIAAIILSKLQRNKTIFARNCDIKRVDKKQAVEFLDRYHIMNATQSAYNLGLFYKEELIALASFSKGRKMNRLGEHQRSFELIRFCCKSGITVTGGLTRLVKTFCVEKGAGDVMTYVDKQLSDGSSFVRSGFKKHSETEPNYFLVNRSTFERRPVPGNIGFDRAEFYLSHNSGNIKLIYTPG